MAEYYSKVRPIDWKLVPDGGIMVLLTMRDIVDQADLMIADFKDTHALVFTMTGNFVGLTKDRGARLGKKPIRMINGIWYAFEDLEAQKKYKNVDLTANLLSFKPIR
jgi:hypothetical protein